MYPAAIVIEKITKTQEQYGLNTPVPLFVLFLMVSGGGMLQWLTQHLALLK